LGTTRAATTSLAERRAARDRLAVARGIGVALSELLQWWNLIFALPLVGAVLYILALGFGVLGHDVDAQGAEHALSGSHDAPGHDTPTGVAAALDFLGIGRVPLAIVLPSFWLIWSFTGFAANAILGQFVEMQSGYAVVSIALATLSAVTITGTLSRSLARLMPRIQTYGVATEDLVGLVGVAGYPGITRRFGEARVYDAHGNQHTVSCRLRSDGETIRPGDTLLLIEFDSTNRLFLVEPYADDA
jgi:hypothetical protein